MLPLLPVIGGVFLANCVRGMVGVDKSTSNQESRTSQTPPQKAASAPWFNEPKTRWVHPVKLKTKEFSLADLVELATVAAQIRGLLQDESANGIPKVPIRDPGLEDKLDKLLVKLDGVLSQMEKNSIASDAFWTKYANLCAVYQHYDHFQAQVLAL